MTIASENRSLYLSPREAAELLSISRVTVYRLCSRGALPSVRVGGQVRIPRRDLTRILNQEEN